MTHQDLDWLRSHAIGNFNQMRPDLRLEGGPVRYLNVEEMRILSFYQASVLLLSRDGKLIPGACEKDLIEFKERDSGPIFDTPTG